MLKFEFVEKQTKGTQIVRVITQVHEGEHGRSSMYYVPIDYWSADEYIQHWLLAVKRLETNGKSSFLLLAGDSKEPESYFECYNAWKQNDAYIFQLDCLYASDFEKPIDINQPWRYIADEPSSELESVKITQSDIDQLKMSLTADLAS